LGKAYTYLRPHSHGQNCWLLRTMSEIKYESKESVQRNHVMMDDVLAQLVAAILWNVEMKLDPSQLETVEKETIGKLCMCGVSLQRLAYLISREECTFSHPRPPYPVDKRTILVLLGWGQGSVRWSSPPPSTEEDLSTLPLIHTYGVFVQDLAGFFPRPTKMISDLTNLLLHSIQRSPRRSCDTPQLFLRLIQRSSPRAYHRSSSTFAAQVILQIITRQLLSTARRTER